MVRSLYLTLNSAVLILDSSTWHNHVHEPNPSKESETLKRCFHYLQKTSRSFSAVIQELHPELLAPIALFYLILRGLDTIEDEMTIRLEKKDPLLRDFTRRSRRRDGRSTDPVRTRRTGTC